jgi:hypothetical protein
MIDSFFGLHPFLVRSGLWAKMKPGEKDLYVFLMAESERRCTREIAATDAEVTVAVGAASRTLCNARKKLWERGLIQYKAGRGNRYRYVICDPKTGAPYSGGPRERIAMPKGVRNLPKNGPRFTSSSQHNDVREKADQQELPTRSYGVPGIFP